VVRKGLRGLIVRGLVVALGLPLIAGCAGPSRLRQISSSGSSGSSASTASAPATPAGRAYLQRLAAEQAQLSQAEAAIPRHAPTPRALSHSIALLAAAIDRLAGGLSAIEPPHQVAGLHDRLVEVVRAYHRRLVAASSLARTREGELSAANALASATRAATRAFTSTYTAITARLARERGD
jgi:hypothetical protein